MLPAVIAAGETAVTVAPRLAPWLSRAASGNPAFLASLVARIRSAGIVVGDKVADIVAAAKKSPVNALTIVAAIASLGYSVSELFSDHPEPAERDKVVDALNKISAGQTPAHREAAMALLFEVGEKSVDKLFDLSKMDEDRIEALRLTLSWARNYFGGIGPATRAHMMMQAFFEIPAATMAQGFRQLNLED